MNKLNNEIQFFKKLDSAIELYRKLKKEQITKIGSIGSGSLQSINLLTCAFLRRMFVMKLREGIKSSEIDFSKIENQEYLAKIKNKTLKNAKNLFNKTDSDIFRAVCNSIAHGDIISMYPFEREKDVYKFLLSAKKMSAQYISDFIRSFTSMDLNVLGEKFLLMYLISCL